VNGDGFNGDLFVYLDDNGAISVLLNRPGKTAIVLCSGADRPGTVEDGWIPFCRHGGEIWAAGVTMHVLMWQVLEDSWSKNPEDGQKTSTDWGARSGSGGTMCPIGQK
jgi:hypothetical protein